MRRQSKSVPLDGRTAALHKDVLPASRTRCRLQTPGSTDKADTWLRGGYLMYQAICEPCGRQSPPTMRTRLSSCGTTRATGMV